MNPIQPAAPNDENEEISALIETLHETGQRLEDLTAGEVDAVADRHGRTFLLRRAQDQLRHSEAAKQAAILNALPAHIALLDAQGVIVLVNEAWRRSAGAMAPQAPGYGMGVNYLGICDSACGDGAAEAHRVAEGIRSVLNGGVNSFSIEYPCHSPTEQRWFLLTVTPLAGDHPSGAVVMHLNITERKRDEGALQRFANAINAITDGIFLIDRSSMRFVYVNDAACRYMNLTREELLRLEPWVSLSTSRAELERSYDALIAGGVNAKSLEMLRRGRDGSEVWVEMRRHAQRSGDRWTIVTLARDVTKRKQDESALRESEDRYRDIVENSGILICTHDLEGKLQSANAAVVRFTGYSREALLRMNVADLLTPGTRDGFAAYLTEILTKGTARGLMQIRTAGGNTRWWEYNNTLRTEGVAAPVVRGMGEDVTERKAAEAKIARLTQFYAALSHCSQAIARCTSEEQLLQQICRAAVVFGGMKMAWIGFIDPGTRMVRFAARYGDRADEYLQGVEISVDPDSPLGRGPTGIAIRDNRPYWSQDLQHEPITAPWQERRARFGWAASASLPLRKAGVAVGVLTLYAGEAGAFDEAVSDLLIEMAADISFGLDNFERESRRQLAEGALRESEARFRSLTEMSSDFYWESDAEHRLTRRGSADKKVSAVSVFRQGAHIGERRWEIPYLSPDEAGWQAHREVLDTHRPFRDFELSRLGADGAERHISISGDPVFDASGAFQGYRGVGTDITERRQAEESRKHREAELAESQRIARIGSWEWTIATGAVTWSDGMNHVLARDEGSPSPTFETLPQFYTPESWQRLGVAIDGAIEAGAPYDLQLEMIRADGATCWTTTRGEAIRGADGTVVKLRGTVHDITEQKQVMEALRRSEDRYRDIVENSGVIICTHDLEGKLLSVNAAMVRFTGYPQEALLRMNVADLLTRGAQDRFAAYLAEIRTKGTARGSMQIRTADGESRWWEYHNTLRTEGVDVPVVRGMGEEVTERKAAQDALRESEAELRAIFEGALDGIALVDTETRKFVTVNPELCRMLGYRLEEIVGVGIADIHQKQDLPRVMTQFERQWRSETQLAADIPVMRKDGSVFYADIKAARIRLGGKDAMLKIFRDTTERKHMEERLQKLSHAIEQSPAATVITDIHGRFEYVNPKFIEITGYSQEEVIGKTHAVIKSGLTPPGVYEDLWRTILSGREWHGEMQNRRKDGNLYWEYEIISPLKDEQGGIVNFVAVKEDITERKAREEELRRFRAAMDATVDAIYLVDHASMRFIDVNEAACRMQSRTREELLALGPGAVMAMPREKLERIYASVIAGGRGTQPVEMLRRRKDGSQVWVELVSRAQRFGENWTIITTVRDITKRKLAEEALKHEHASLMESQQQLLNAHESLAKADRLESVGRLAAGVAHEVKNPLTIIRLGTDYLAKQFPQESNQEVLDDVRAAIDRAEHVIRDLLEFSRQKPVDRRPTSIGDVIDNAIDLIKHEIDRRNIAIIRNSDDPMPPIYADPERLVQVFINLLSNAVQAIGQGGSIEIVERSIRVSERDMARSEASTFKIGEPAVTVDIRDSGPGISAEHENKLFEPFFTTKSMGEGSGLGLAVSRNIVIMHGGSISISNRPEGGASALLMFRVAREHLTNEKANTGSR